MSVSWKPRTPAHVHRKFAAPTPMASSSMTILSNGRNFRRGGSNTNAPPGFSLVRGTYTSSPWLWPAIMALDMHLIVSAVAFLATRKLLQASTSVCDYNSCMRVSNLFVCVCAGLCGDTWLHADMCLHNILPTPLPVHVPVRMHSGIARLYCGAAAHK